MRIFSSPLKTLFLSWLFLFGIYYSGIITYNDIPDGTWGFLYVLLFLAIFALGYISVVGWKEANLPKSSYDGEIADTWKEEIRRFRPIISIFAVCGIAAALLFTYEMIFIVHIDPFDLLSTRDLYLEREATIYSQIAVVLGAGGFFSLVSAILFWEYLSPFNKVFWLISPFLLSVFSIFSAGRQTVLQLVLISLIAWSLTRFTGIRTLHHKTAKIIVGIFVLLVLGYGMVAAYQRNAAKIEVSKKDLLMRIFNAQLNPMLDEALDVSPPIFRDGISEMIVYFSHEIPSYRVFWELPRPEIHFGLWELPFLARRLNSLGIVSYSVEEEMDQVYARFESSGSFPQVWQTGIRDLIMDFGLSGSLIMAGILGFASGRIYRKFRSERSLSAAFLLVGINLCCAYSIMLAVISDTLVFFYIMMAIFLYFLPNHRSRMTELQTNL